MKRYEDEKPNTQFQKAYKSTLQDRFDVQGDDDEMKDGKDRTIQSI